jgi:RNA polymerase sigma-B factor
VQDALLGTEKPMVAVSHPVSEPARARRGDDAALLERYFQGRDPKDRDALAERYLPLARHLSRKYFAAGEHADLEQVAALGLLKAIDRFDPTRGIAFTSFAVPTIIGELKRYFRDQGWSVRVPRSLKELAAKVEAATESLLEEAGRAPTVEELARRCETTVEAVLEARQLRSAHRAASLDAPVAGDTERRLVETLAVDDRGYERVEDGADLDRLLAYLPEREQTILRLRFREDMTQREIAARVGLSQMQVSRLINRSIAELGRLADGVPPRRPLL